MSEHIPLIMGLDPGGTTGVALAYWQSDGYHFETMSCNTQEQVWQLIRPPVGLFLTESFDAQLISRYGLDTVRLIGGIQALCFEHNIPITMQTPQQRKPYLSTAKKLATRGPGHTHHEYDAMAHLVRYLYNAKYITKLD